MGGGKSGQGGECTDCIFDLQLQHKVQGEIESPYRAVALSVGLRDHTRDHVSESFHSSLALGSDLGTKA